MNRSSLIVHGAGSIALALTCSLLTAAATDAPHSLAARLNGTWIENEAKRDLGGFPPLRFQKTSAGDLNELRGPEAAPLSEPVHFDGKQYPIDGGKAAIAWKQTGPNKFERQGFSGGKIATNRRIEISADGRKLTEVFESSLSEKPRTTTTVYSREAGTGTSLEGRWKVESFHSSLPAEIKIEAVGPNAIRATNALGQTFTVALDGKPAEITGPTVISGGFIAMKPVNSRKIGTAATRNGVATAKGTWTLSPEGKTLTMSSTQLGPNSTGAASVTVYEKQ